jgi:hypothetical protein
MRSLITATILTAALGFAVPASASESGAVGGAVTGGVGGAIIGGPVGLLVGAGAGALVGDAVTPHRYYYYRRAHYRRYHRY